MSNLHFLYDKKLENTVKATRQEFFDKGDFDNDKNADNALKHYSSFYDGS